ncbi:MAG: acyl transferase [Flavobacteriales bacterium]
MQRSQILNRVQNIQNNKDFEMVAMDLFKFQAEHCEVYKNYLHFLSKSPGSVQSIVEIPFLPIEVFKKHAVKSGDWDEQIIFTSSGTTGMEVSKHFVKDLSLYEWSFLNGFEKFYGNPANWTILALLPSYLERKGSSLIYMAEKLIGISNDKRSGFFLNDHKELARVLKALVAENKQTLLLGVTFGLLDFAEDFELDLQEVVVMETGGMKGRREEWTRDQVHEILKKQWNINKIHSEYGMTELLSQAYSIGDGIFKTPEWMKVLWRDTSDPLLTSDVAGSGGLNVIDLCNVDSCAFIATQDLVKIQGNGSFEVMGRFDHSDVRGCNLLVV